MKILFKMFALAIVLFTAANANAEGPHGHEHEAHAGGPKGGRLLENTNPHAEFFVEKDRSMTVTFYDEELKSVPVAEQNVSVIAELEGKKTTLEFEKKGDVLASKGVLPEGHPINLVVRLKQAPDAKMTNFRFAYEDHICPECKRAEYACICGH